MHDPVAVEVKEAVEELKEDRFDHAGGDGMSLWLGVMVDDLEEIMLAIFEDHEDTFVLENDLHEMDQVRV